MYTFEQAKKLCLPYFKNDELATDTFLKKYAVLNEKGEYVETNPDQMWHRLAKAGASIEQDKEKWEKEFYNIFKDFRAVPQGSIMYALGNTYQKSSCSNCFVFKVEDSIESIFDTAKEMARTYSYRGGCGLDISPLRPASARVSNAAKSSSGAASFMNFYSEVTRMMGIHGRRGALMLTISVDHPDIELFTTMKHDLKKVTGANVSIRISDAFMKAIENDKEWIAQFKTKHEVIEKKWKARDLWKIIVNSATNYAEPGILFWDNIIKNSPADCYGEEYKTVSTNPCLSELSTVLTKSGIIKFTDLKVGDEIWSESGWTKVIKKWSNGIKKVYKYSTNSGNFYSTDNHRVVCKGIKKEVKDAKFLDVLRGGEKNFTTSDLIPELIMDGLVIGDGSRHLISKEKVYLNVGSNDNDYFDSEVSHLIFGKHSVSIDKAYKIKTTITPEELPLLPNRKIPERFLYKTTLETASFLRGLYSANGSICGKRVTLKSTNFDLILQVRLMLNSLGIISYYTTNKESEITWANGKKYTSKQSYDLNISTDAHLFVKNIGFIQKYKNEKINTILNNKKCVGRTKKSYEIISSEFVKKLEVFDITVDNETHTFWCDGFNISNCSELPLENYGACTLLSMNLAKYTVNDFKDNAYFNEKEFLQDVSVATRFLDNVKTIDSDLMPLEQQRIHAKQSRRIGMGIHGLADALANLRIKYDSKEGVGFINKLFEKYTKCVYGTSVELAKEKSPFPIFDASKEKGNLFLERIGFAGIPRRNIALMTLAPTGTVSLLSQTSSGIEPVFRNSYKRRVKINHNEIIKEEDKSRLYVDALGDKWLEYEVYHPNAKRYLDLTGEIKLPDYFVSSEEINWKKRVEIQASITKWLDHSASSTINLPKGTSSKTVGDIYFEAWRSGCKGMTVYVDGCRDGVLITTEEGGKSKADDKSSVSRPTKIPCDIYQIQADGDKWTVIIGLVDDKPYEVFCGRSSKVDLNKISKGYIEKESRGNYSLHIGEDTILRNISDIFTDTQGAITRLISTSLRHRVDIKFIVQQLEKSDGSLYSFSKAISRVLKKYIIDGEKENGSKCSSCGQDTLIRQDGCVQCTNCAWTKCN